MAEAIAERKKELAKDGYRPKHLAVDEFAIHKGHKYATCVMDLDEGDVLWVGKGRTKADFSRFFQEIDMNYLSEVEAVAMDMKGKDCLRQVPHAGTVRKGCSRCREA